LRGQQGNIAAYADYHSGDKDGRSGGSSQHGRKGLCREGAAGIANQACGNISNPHVCSENEAATREARPCDLEMVMWDDAYCNELIYVCE